jgi:hypothetical protein
VSAPKIEKMVLIYDQASGHEGIHALAHFFDHGWETLMPLRYIKGWRNYYCTVLYRPLCTCQHG